MAEELASIKSTELDPTVEAILRQAWMESARKSTIVQRILFESAMSRLPAGSPPLAYSDVRAYLLRLRTPWTSESGKAKEAMSCTKITRSYQAKLVDPAIRNQLIEAIRSTRMAGASSNDLQALFPGIALGQLDAWCSTLVREGHIAERVQHQPKSKRGKPRYVALDIGKP